MQPIEQDSLNTYAGKQLSKAATYILLTLVLKNEQHLDID
jgi:hypothetical protein